MNETDTSTNKLSCVLILLLGTEITEIIILTSLIKCNKNNVYIYKPCTPNDIDNSVFFFMGFFDKNMSRLLLNLMALL